MDVKDILKELKEMQKFVQKNKFEQDEIKHSYDGECKGGVFVSAKGVESRLNILINKVSKV